MSVDWFAPFFDGWDSVYRTGVTALVMYPVVILAIRLNGKRSVSKMNNFDWIVTVAIGSLVSSAIAFEAVTIVDATLAIALLLVMQRVITHHMAKSERFESLLTPNATMLVKEGQLRRSAMEHERISEAELMSAIRHSGLSGPEDCYAVVLESNAEFTVIPTEDARPSGRALASLDG